VAVLSPKYPNKIAQFMAYQKKLSEPTAPSSERDGGLILASIENLDWGEVDLTLYNETFVGRAKILQHCNICLSELHATS